MATVLLVDDEPSIRRAVHYWLERRGHEVHSASSIAEALTLLGQHRYEGAFIDLWLPDGLGFELYAEIQRRYPKLARNIVFVSGDILPDATIRGQLQALGHPILSKPFDLDELDHYTRAWVRTSGGWTFDASEDPSAGGS